MVAIPRYRVQADPALLSAGFRPFFLLASLWAAVAMPLWLIAFSGDASPPTALAPLYWHAHEMIYGFAAAAVAGFLLTAIPNWTGRMPLQGAPLAALALLWLFGRIAVLLSAKLGAPLAAVIDLAFPLVFLLSVGREIIAGRNWRNLPMLAALAGLLAGNLLVHLESVGLAETAGLGNRLGIAILLMLISLVGGRIIPSFTRNWLVRERPRERLPAPAGPADSAALAITAVALAAWVAAPDSALAAGAESVAGIAVAIRLLRWRGAATLAQPLLWSLHLGQLWLSLGFLLPGLVRLHPFLPTTSALHALTAGAVGTMILAVMTRVTLGHTGRPLTAGRGTVAIYALVTAAALLRVAAPLAGADYLSALWLAGGCWSGAFGLFLLLYAGALTRPRVTGAAARAI